MGFFLFSGKKDENSKIIAFWQNSYLDNYWSCWSSIPSKKIYPIIQIINGWTAPFCIALLVMTEEWFFLFFGLNGKRGRMEGGLKGCGLLFLKLYLNSSINRTGI